LDFTNPRDESLESGFRASKGVIMEAFRNKHGVSALILLSCYREAC
jgi:hypothetical protein